MLFVACNSGERVLERSHFRRMQHACVRVFLSQIHQIASRFFIDEPGANVADLIDYLESVFEKISPGFGVLRGESYLKADLARLMIWDRAIDCDRTASRLLSRRTSLL